MPEEKRACKNCSTQFTVAPDDFSFYEKIGVPAPNICPQCRFQRRCLYRNESTLYTRQCGLCKKSMISMYHPNSPYTVYCNACWHSDKWDPFSFGKEYDPGRPFFEQLGELMKAVPKETTYSSSYASNINSDYINFAGGGGGVKNCYLLFNSGQAENVLYARGIREAKDCMDGYYGFKIERCYEIVNVEESAGTSFGQNVNGMLDSMFVMNCSGCSNCFGCVNLRHKTHHLFNEPLSKEEYEKRVHEIHGSYIKTEGMKKKFESFSLKFPRRATQNLKTTASSGNFLIETNNVRDSFEVTKSENGRYLFFMKSVKDSYDGLGFGYDSELLLDTVAVGYTSRAIGSVSCGNCTDIEYCFGVQHGEHCIGCDGLRNTKFSILNHRYDETEYKKIREGIVEELKRMGAYGLSLPPSLAPFAYNETIAQDNLPLTKEKAKQLGFRWENTIQITRGKETMQPKAIPDRIADTPDTILNEILACIECGRNYKIIPAELQLYRQFVLPIPRKCFFCRHRDRIRRRGPFQTFTRACAKCHKEIQTTYAPDRPEIVYCESCYQSEVA